MTIFADGMAKTLYIIAGCNGAGKTTASMLLLPEILDCQEFVNADEIAKGISPFHPVREGGHDIPRDVILRRYSSGINNLFNIYMDIVDSWIVVENYNTPRTVIADGGINGSLYVYSEELFLKLKSYVRRREN